MATHIYTSVVSNYIPKARVLAHSVKRFHPDFYFHLVLCDEPPPSFHIDEEPFDSLIRINDLGLARPEQWLFVHSTVEVCTGVKGLALKLILDAQSCSEAFYFDPDIVILAPLDNLIQRFRDGSVLLTPHLTEPETHQDAILDNEFSVLQHGIYNLGFVGVKNDAEGRRFARWWSDRLEEYCFDDIPRGLFTDQKWVDLAPAFFPSCVILHDPVYNVATWNLTTRTVGGTLGDVTVNGSKVVFYHFSGFDSGAQEAMLNKYGSAMPVLYDLREWYIAESKRMGQDEFGVLPWRYGSFDNGATVTKEHRRVYRDRGDVRAAFPNPYCTSDISASYYHWFEAEREQALSAVGPEPGAGELRYRIVVSITGSDLSLARETITAVLANSRATNFVYLAGTESTLSAVRQYAPASWGSLPVVASGHEANFAAALASPGDGDILFIQAGVAPPEAWDLRLAWTARRHPGTATVSPLTASLVPQRVADAVARDRIAYAASEFELIELTDFARDCVYVCLDAIRDMRSQFPNGAFDALARVARELRYSHLLADHLYVHRCGAVEGPSKVNHQPSAEALRRVGVRIASRVDDVPSAIDMRPRQLHIMHSWGGGLERWVREYCRADGVHTNYVLKSTGTWNSFGMDLRLYKDVDDPEPLQVWPLTPAIKGTHLQHDSYRSALVKVVERYGIGRVLISSFIGHSLDALRLGLPTGIVCHDFYPFCPALNITFGEVCGGCNRERLSACTRENPHHRFFRNVPPAAWMDVRRSFIGAVQQSGAVMIAPSPSVRDSYAKLAPELERFFRVIPHGTPRVASGALDLSLAGDRPLRVLVLGSIAPNKGLALLQEAIPEILQFARVFLVGCGSDGQEFEEMPGVTVLPRYAWEHLPAILRELDPDVALLPSIVPETFSYTLDELNQLGIPTLATNIGSFADRIRDGVTGLLSQPTAAKLVAHLRNVCRDREILRRIHANLRTTQPRAVAEMINDYDAAVAAPDAAQRAYFSRDSHHGLTAPAEAAAQLYWRSTEQQYAEEQSLTLPFRKRAGRQTLRFAVPIRHSPPAELRFDPAANSGIVLLHSMRVLDNRGATIQEWRGSTSTLESLPVSDLSILGEPSRGGVLLLLGQTDPHILLPLASTELLWNGAIFEADLTWSLRSALPQSLEAALIAGEGARLTREDCDRLAHQDEGFGPESSDSLHMELSRARVRITDLENSASWRVTAPIRIAGSAILNLNRRISRKGKDATV